MPNIKKGKKRLEVLINEDLYKQLVEIAPGIYGVGKYRGALSYVVEEALKLYIEKYGGAGGSPPPGERGERTHTSPFSRVVRDLDTIKQLILQMAEPGGSISKKGLERIIMSMCKVYDKRSIEARIKALVSEGFLRPDGFDGGSNPIFRISYPNFES